MFNFVTTLGANLFYISDGDSNDAPLIELRFHNEFADHLSEEQKTRISEKVLITVTKMIAEELHKDF